LRHAVLRSLTAQYSFLQFDLLFVVFLRLRALYIVLCFYVAYWDRTTRYASKFVLCFRRYDR